MIMATIKSLLNKIKPGDPKEDSKELTEESSKALKEIDVKPLLDEYSAWENKALKSLAETSSTLYQLKEHIMIPYKSLRQRKERYAQQQQSWRIPETDLSPTVQISL